LPRRRYRDGRKLCADGFRDSVTAWIPCRVGCRSRGGEAAGAGRARASRRAAARLARVPLHRAPCCGRAWTTPRRARNRSLDDVRNFAKLLRPGRPTVVSAAAPCGTGWSSPAHASVVCFGVLVVASTLSAPADRFTPPGMAGRRGLAVHTTVACTRRRLFVHMLRNPVACCMLQCFMLQCCMLHGVCCMLQGVCCQRHGRVTATHAARCMLCCMPRVACRTMHAACRASLHLCRSAAWTSL
jgi:hypothetical protein